MEKGAEAKATYRAALEYTRTRYPGILRGRSQSLGQLQVTRKEALPITDDTPLRLSAAAELAFPGGGMTASGLRKEAGRGRLVIERIAGKDYTTLAAIAKMRELCRVIPKSQPEVVQLDEAQEVARRALAKLRTAKRRL
jgi:hypothetical protein